MNLTNLTPHVINILDEDGKEATQLNPSGQVARCHVIRGKTKKIGPVQLYSSKYGEVLGLPDSAEDTFFVVSLLVVKACPQRTDLLSPGELKRDSQGRPIGCIGLST